MLLGAEIHIHTDHKNILNVGDSSERRLRWISYVDEYSPTLHYVEGPRNDIADTFSRLSRQDDTSALVGKKATSEDSEVASYSLFMTRRSLTVWSTYRTFDLNWPPPIKNMYSNEKKELYSGAYSGIVFFPGPVGAWKPPEIHRFHYSRGA